MSTLWIKFVHQAIAGPPDPADVAALQSQLAQGSTLYSVELIAGSEPPSYRVLLERLHELSESMVLHSGAFTRWSIANRVRMMKVDNEIERFALLVEDEMESRFSGSDGMTVRQHLDAWIRHYSPPGARGALDALDMHGANPVGRHLPPKLNALWTGELTAGFSRLAEVLGVSLRYPESTAAKILDRALARYVASHLPTVRIENTIAK